MSDFSRELIPMKIIEDSIKEHGFKEFMGYLKNPRVLGLGLAKVRNEGEIVFLFPYIGIEVITDLYELGKEIEKMYFSIEGSRRKNTVENMKEKYKSMMPSDYPDYGYLHKLLEAIDHLEKFIVLTRVYATEWLFA